MEATTADVGSLAVFADDLRSRTRLSPGDGNLYMALGMALQSWDMQEHTGGTHQPEALQAYRTAMKLGNVKQEELATLYLNCGVLLTTMSMPNEALGEFQKALDLEPGLASAHQRSQIRYYRGQAHSSMGKLRDAEAEYFAVLAEDPHYTRAYSSLVAVAKDDARTTVDWHTLVPMLEECLEWLEAQLKRDIAEPLMLVGSGGGASFKSKAANAPKSGGKALVEEAMEAALRDGNPDPIKPLRGLITQLSSAAMASLSLDVPTPGALGSSSSPYSRGGGGGGGLVSSQQTALKALNDAFADLANIHFCLFNAHEAFLGGKVPPPATPSDDSDEAALDFEPSPDAAWRHLVLGNAFEAARRPMQMGEAEEQQVAMYSSVFKRGFWPQSIGSTDQTPIFVVGLMRSGSTLVETVLGSHSKVYGMGEDSVFNGMLPVIRDGVVSSISSGRLDVLSGAVDRFALEVVEGMLSKVPPGDDDNDGGGGGGASSSSREKKKKKKKAKDAAVKHVVDKMLFNFRNIGFIHLLFPNAKIIHTVRGFMDTLLSNYKYKFEDSGLEWSFSVADLAHFFACYRRLMRHWERVLPGRLLTVQYEHMVQAPRESMERLLKHCGLPWEDGVMQFHKTERVVHTFSQQQVKQGIYTTSVKGSLRYEARLLPLLDQASSWTHELKPLVMPSSGATKKHGGGGGAPSLNWVTGDLVAEDWVPPSLKAGRGGGGEQAPPPPPAASGAKHAPANNTEESKTTKAKQSSQEGTTTSLPSSSLSRSSSSSFHSTSPLPSSSSSFSSSFSPSSSSSSSSAASLFAAKLDELEKAKSAAVAREDYRLAADLKDEITALKIMGPAAAATASLGTSGSGSSSSSGGSSGEFVDAPPPPPPPRSLEEEVEISSSSNADAAPRSASCQSPLLSSSISSALARESDVTHRTGDNRVEGGRAGDTDLASLLPPLNLKPLDLGQATT